MPLVLKVGIPVVLISIVGTLVVGAAALTETEARIDQTYVSQADDLAGFIEDQYLLTQDRPPMITKMDNLIVDHPTVTRIRLFDRPSHGKPTLWASTFPLDNGMNPQPFDVSSSVAWRNTEVDGQGMLEVVVPVAHFPDFTDIAVYFSLQARNEAIASITRRIGMEVVMVTVFEALALAASMYLLVIRRIRRIDRAAVAVAEGDLSVRLPEGSESRGRDELVNVAREFDHMVDAVRARVEKEREDAERLRQLNEAKNTLLHAVSHDLRSPLTSVLGSAATLQQADQLGLLEKERAEFLAGILTSARKMHRLVTDLLDLDRLDRGIVEPERLPTDVGALARKVVDELEALRDRPVEIDAPPVIVSVDGPKVERIIENLLANAVRHTRPGTPIRATVAAREGGALIVVEDEGSGVPDDIKEEIFESFRQGAGASGGGGVGIGLSLVARFAELHGGRAWVEDRDGGGASFKVFLPDEPAGPSPAPDGDGDGVVNGAAARIANERGGRSSTG